MIEELGSQFSRLVGPKFGKIVAYALGAWVVIQALTAGFDVASKLIALLPPGIEWAVYLRAVVIGASGVFGAVIALLLFVALIPNSPKSKGVDPVLLELMAVEFAAEAERRRRMTEPKEE